MQKFKHLNLNVVAPEIAVAPRVDWSRMDHPWIIQCLMGKVSSYPWANELFLLAGVVTLHNCQPNSIINILNTVHRGLRDLFQAFNLKTMRDWNPDKHIPPYLRGSVLPEDTEVQRYRFRSLYTVATGHLKRWLSGLSETDKQSYSVFVLRPADPDLTRSRIKAIDIFEQQREQRKSESEAIVDLYPEIRYTAHMRYNKLARLREIYLSNIALIQKGQFSPPLDFIYEEEGASSKERLYFRIWNRESFILAHRHMYKSAQSRLSEHRKRNYYFLELLQVKSPEDNCDSEGFWFQEILEIGAHYRQVKVGNADEIAARQEWFRKWGYGQANPHQMTDPFTTKVPGIMSWAADELRFNRHAQRLTTGLLIPVEPLFAAASFGLLALDLFTTTGMRINELMQISLRPSCFVKTVEKPPMSATDRSPRIRYLLRLIPKGERTETLQDYPLSDETPRLINKVYLMLKEHYELQDRANLPLVKFAANLRAFRFPEQRPYLFQYNYKHLDAVTITGCMRFLLHGMQFETARGQPVVIKAHLLRHAFATYAVQVVKLPVDVVAALLHQKDLGVTEYYSQATEGILRQQHDLFIDSLAAHVNLSTEILRLPEEIQSLIEEARDSAAGILAPVPGGGCTIQGRCPVKHACIGCHANAPDPSKRSQIEEIRQHHQLLLDYYTREGFSVEAARARKFVQKCNVMLKEMDLIERYRQDEQLRVESYVPASNR